ncbi:MAG: hypothetical protein CMN32_09685 [Saprospirales bacterium]|nr:hypothetical protein [Saprospirales bacterium]
MDNLFASLTHEDSIAFLISVFVSFLIGYVTAWLLYGSRVSKLKKKLKAVRDELSQAAAERDQLREELDLGKADMVRMERESEELAAYIRKLEEERSQWLKELKDAHQRAARAEEDARSYAGTIEDLNNQLLGLKTRMGNAAPVNGETDSTAARMAALEEKITRLLAEKSTAKGGPDPAEFRETKKRLAAMEKRFSALMDENEALRRELAEAKGMQLKEEKQPVSESLSEVMGAAVQKAVAGKGKSTSKTPKPKAPAKDDLTRIKGIGPGIEEKLNAMGIYNFEQISHFDEEDIERVSVALGSFKNRILRDDWVGQATKLFEEQKAVTRDA